MVVMMGFLARFALMLEADGEWWIRANQGVFHVS
jgi:hypothetical protein